MSSDAPYSISDLARLTGLSVRTIRYYLAQGLIPASGESGPGAHYGEGHLGRLRLVRRLQQQHLPLAEIRARLAALTDAEVGDLAAAGEPPVSTGPETSALDYIRAVLTGSSGTAAPTRPMHQAPPSAPSAAPAPPMPSAMPAMRDTPGRTGRFVSRLARTFDAGLPDHEGEPSVTLASAALQPSIAPAIPSPIPSSSARPTETVEPAPTSIERSQWERLSLGPNLELHVRRPLGRLEQKRVERLITIARQVLKEEQP